MGITPHNRRKDWRRSRWCGRRGSIRRSGGGGNCGGWALKRGRTSDKRFRNRRTNFIPGADANNLTLQMRTWEKHDVGGTTGFGGDVEKALRSIKAPFLYMPSETDLYFPLGDAKYEAGFITGVTLTPIPSLWGHTAGAASNAADGKFLNEKIKAFLAATK